MEFVEYKYEMEFGIHLALPRMHIKLDNKNISKKK